MGYKERKENNNETGADYKTWAPSLHYYTHNQASALSQRQNGKESDCPCRLPTFSPYDGHRPLQSSKHRSNYHINHLPGPPIASEICLWVSQSTPHSDQMFGAGMCAGYYAAKLTSYNNHNCIHNG